MDTVMKIWDLLNPWAADQRPRHKTQEEPHPLPSQSPRLSEKNGLFTIKADLVSESIPGTLYWPVLYLRTSCAAVADYCLLGRRADARADENRSLDLPKDSLDHLEVCLRMQRCGAVNTTPKAGMHGEDSPNDLGKHLNLSRYVFGWPWGDLTGSTTDTPEPVWVYDLMSRPDEPELQDAVLRYGMEAHLRLDWLKGCATLSEYCARLEAHGATYYSDVRDSPEAAQLSMSYRPTSIEEACRKFGDHRSRR